jgi:hypothetical protein
MEAITYEWGSPNHDGGNNQDVSPDDTAQAQMANGEGTQEREAQRQLKGYG